MKQKYASGLRENSLYRKILVVIYNFLGVGVTILTTDYPTMKKMTGMIFARPYRIRRNTFYLSKYLYNLERRGYLKRIKSKIMLTRRGEMEIFKYKLKSKTKKLKWDGKWRGISWDVPEISRGDRDYLRRKLRWLGFKELQKSLWVFPFDIRNEVKELIKLYKDELAGDVRFLTIEKIENDKDLKDHFNLN